MKLLTYFIQKPSVKKY
ncbi:Protein of unknown function [Gryllus bimaculatus]|nr:Protein of unknown function [Gryllus bimaculatus]